MKRGAFVGELSQLVTLSSMEQFYVAAIEDLKRIYYCRGYPDNVVKSWLSKNAKNRWETKSRNKTHDSVDPLFILKSVIHILWDSVARDEVLEVMM